VKKRKKKGGTTDDVVSDGGKSVMSFPDAKGKAVVRSWEKVGRFLTISEGNEHTPLGTGRGESRGGKFGIIEAQTGKEILYRKNRNLGCAGKKGEKKHIGGRVGGKKPCEEDFASYSLMKRGM